MNSEKIMENLIKNKNKKVVKESSKYNIDLYDMYQGLEQYYKIMMEKMNSLTIEKQLELIDGEPNFISPLLKAFDYFSTALYDYFVIKSLEENKDIAGELVVSDKLKNYNKLMKDIEDILSHLAF